MKTRLHATQDAAGYQMYNNGATTVHILRRQREQWQQRRNPVCPQSRQPQKGPHRQ